MQFLWPMLPMIKFVKIIVIFSNFRYISGVIWPRKYSLIKVFKNRFFFIILEIDAHKDVILA